MTERTGQKDVIAPPQRREQHREDPAHWGWHGEWGRGARIAGWVVTAALLLMITSVDYGFSGAAWLIGLAATIVAILVWDARRRRTWWRK